MNPTQLGRTDDWGAVSATVIGLGSSGFAAADALQHLGARVTVVDDSTGVGVSERATLLEILGVEVRLGAGSVSGLTDLGDVVIPSPGVAPHAAALTQAAVQSIPIWSEVELAWRLRHPDAAAQWLAVTGTNGKTTVVSMLQQMLQAAGLTSHAVGNIGRPVCEAVMDPEPCDYLAVELSSFQLHYLSSAEPTSAAVLNVAEDHLTWHGDYPSYVADKGRIYSDVATACIYNVEDRQTENLVREADVQDGARAIGFTLQTPAVGMLGLVDDVLCDRAFITDRQRSAAELITVGELVSPAPHFVANALAAAAMARSVGVTPAQVRSALLAFEPGGHRLQRLPANASGLEFVDDSKATNPHAAMSALASFDSVVWIAGGQAKGASFDELVRRFGPKLRGAVLIGIDADLIAAELAKHAPNVPMIRIATGETQLMDKVVSAAARMARPGDVVLLAPGCASQDQFVDYADRGNQFKDAVARHLSQGMEPDDEN